MRQTNSTSRIVSNGLVRNGAKICEIDMFNLSSTLSFDKVNLTMGVNNVLDEQSPR